jgi:hypothetical protein
VEDRAEVKEQQEMLVTAVVLAAMELLVAVEQVAVMVMRKIPVVVAVAVEVY